MNGSQWAEPTLLRQISDWTKLSLHFKLPQGRPITAKELPVYFLVAVMMSTKEGN